jgi:hypothetical protein
MEAVMPIPRDMSPIDYGPMHFCSTTAHCMGGRNDTGAWGEVTCPDCLRSRPASTTTPTLDLFHTALLACIVGIGDTGGFFRAQLRPETVAALLDDVRRTSGTTIHPEAYGFTLSGVRVVETRGLEFMEGAVHCTVFAVPFPPRPPRCEAVSGALRCVLAPGHADRHSIGTTGEEALTWTDADLRPRRADGMLWDRDAQVWEST